MQPADIRYRFLRAVILMLLLGFADRRLACGQTVNVWLTTDDQSQKLQPKASVSFSTGTGGNNPIIVDETQTYQRIEGFGASFTDTTGYALHQLATPSQRNAAMTNLFTRNGGGIGLSFVRNPMAACDLSLSVYSYDDLPAGQTDTNLNSFSIAHDQADIIPLVQQALQLNPQLKIMANPWSPPGWMKDSGSMIGGSLLPGMYGPFALYFIKYLQAYGDAGITVNYISLQNEPLYQPANYPGMLMDAATQTVVLRDYLLPALAAHNLTNTTVLVYDHNWDRPDYPTTEFSDAAVNNSPQVTGIAWHGYGGTPGVMLSLENSYPPKGQYLTEHSGEVSIPDQVKADFREIIHVMRSWGKAYVKWNMASDENYGPHTGGCSDCTPLVYVNSTTRNVSYGIEFYTLGHFSKFVLPGAYRIYSSDGAGVDTAAFLNPDNSKVLVAFNDTANSVTFQVQWGNRSFPYMLTSYSGATFTWSGTPGDGYTVNPTNLVTASSFNSISALQTEPTTDTLGGYDLGFASGGSYAGYSNVDLTTGFTNVIGRLASAGSGGTLEFHIDSPTGPMVGSLTIPVTGGWQTWQTVTGLVTGGAGVHTLFARFNGSGGIGNLNWFQFAGATSPLPAPWSGADIGSIGLAGSAALSSGTFTLNGSGNDIWNSEDAFHLVSQPAAGNCEIRARVTSLQPTDPWAKAGVMIRDSAAAGAMNASVVLAASNGVSFQVRPGTGNATTSTVVGVGTLKTPLWLRLVRAANSFAGYYSVDGNNWTQVGASVPLALNNSALIGLAVTAHNNASNCVAAFDNVSVNQSPTLAPIPDQTILAGRTLLITNQASDPDIPAQTLAYSLLNAPAGARMDSAGIFSWRPAISQSPSTQTLSVVVADNGVPSMAATQKFAVTINRPANPLLSEPFVTNSEFGLWVSGDVGPDYLLQSSSNLLSWSTISTSTPPVMPFWLTVTNGIQSPAQFYRIILGP
ncbi:MAG TPA: carbohydrate-binding protein [Verrucomicrobiae bacterium]|jgi:glucosylceramidase|nr:carbohydrate-binding protein [Verrucomicrobiae bacterium]